MIASRSLMGGYSGLCRCRSGFTRAAPLLGGGKERDGAVNLAVHDDGQPPAMADSGHVDDLDIRRVALVCRQDAGELVGRRGKQVLVEDRLRIVRVER